MCGINPKREVKNFHKHLAGLAPLMKTSAKVRGAWEEKAAGHVRGSFGKNAANSECLLCNFYFFFSSVVHYSAPVLSLAVSFLS